MNATEQQQTDSGFPYGEVTKAFNYMHGLWSIGLYKVQVPQIGFGLLHGPTPFDAPLRVLGLRLVKLLILGWMCLKRKV